MPLGTTTTGGGVGPVPLGTTTTGGGVGPVPLPPPPGRTVGVSAMAMLLVVPSEPGDPRAGSDGSASLPFTSLMVAAPPARPSSPKFSKRAVSWPSKTAYANVSVRFDAPDPPL